MSYFDSILASAGISAPNSANAKVASPVPNPRPATSTVAKRKAETELSNPVAKTTRPTIPLVSAGAKPSSTQPLQSYKGTAASSVTPKSTAQNLAKKSTNTVPISKVATKAPPVPAKPSTMVVPKPSVSTVTKAPTAATGKLSFAEMMAKAKALKSTSLGQGPKVVSVNKSAPKTKEELKAAKEARKKGPEPRKPGVKSRPTSRSGSEDPSQVKKGLSKKSVSEEKPKRKPIEIAYKGTMKSSAAPAPAYRGTASTAPAARKNDKSAGRSNYSYGGRYGRERSVSYDEDEEEDVDSYLSDASSDMEAGIWDVDQEEELALKAARAEDLAAQREEEELKRKKAQRKADFARQQTNVGRRR